MSVWLASRAAPCLFGAPLARGHASYSLLCSVPPLLWCCVCLASTPTLLSALQEDGGGSEGETKRAALVRQPLAGDAGLLQVRRRMAYLPTLSILS